MAGVVITKASDFNPDAISKQLKHTLYDDQELIIRHLI